MVTRAKVKSRKQFDKKLAQIWKRIGQGGQVEIAAMYEVGKGPRVWFGCDGLYLTMPIEAARRFAVKFQEAEALDPSLGTLGRDFATAADMAEASTAPVQ
ncbi:hypothetical protein [Brevundimonas sp.]|uniref:hypothetical protein n=1 Tax=Brevundimonas sp. TaxID=1871086 RepID=UPI00286C2135|nr:hypothetical protein [Brevundimonas sp.]